MKVETERLELLELNLLDIYKLELIARDMAWNDTINLLLRHDIGKDAFIANDKKDLFIYRDNIIKQSEGIIGKKYYDFENCDKKNLYSKISQTSIPQNYWHINFPQLAPPFIKSAQDYINGAIKRRKEEPRKSFWLGIKEKESEKIIGVVSISVKVKQDKDKKNRIGHFGRFIHPEFQKKGYISEVGAVMLDFMYKYLIDKNIIDIPCDTVFYTTCDQLNIASQKLQQKSGAILQNNNLLSGERMSFYATREQHENSNLFKNSIKWKAIADNGDIISSITGIDNKFIMDINLIDKIENEGR